MPRGRRRPRRERPREASWTQRLALCAAALAVVAAAITSTVTPARRESMPAALAARPPGYETLEATLQRRGRALTPDDRTLIDRELAALLDEIQPAMIWVLNQPSHELFEATADAAATVQLLVAAPPLATASWSPGGPSRGPALLALDRLEPLLAQELEDLLIATDVELLRTGLVILARRTPTEDEIDLVLPLLAHADEQVRALALTSLPDQLPESAMTQVLGLLWDPVAGVTAAGLLGRVPPGPRSTAAIAQFLAEADGAQLDRVLDKLGPLAAAEPVRDLLWTLAASDAPTQQRAAALQCLEHARDDRELPLAVLQGPPLVRYHAARVYIATSRIEGVDLMLQLLEAPSAADDADEARRVAGQCRLVLSRMARVPPHAPTATFVEWRRGIDELPAAR
ncbi:MAG: hypothetical protein AB7O97_20835 [Planctomycetota bacterium]